MLSRVNLCIALQWYLESLGECSVLEFMGALNTASKIGIDTCAALLGAKNILDEHIQEHGHGGFTNEVVYRRPSGDAVYGPRWVFAPFQESDFSYSDPHGPLIPRTNSLARLVALGAEDAYLTTSPETTFFRASYSRHTNFAVESIEYHAPPPQRSRRRNERQFPKQQRTRQKTSKHCR